MLLSVGRAHIPWVPAAAVLRAGIGWCGQDGPGLVPALAAVWRRKGGPFEGLMGRPLCVEFEASEGSKWACKDKLESQKGSLAGNGGSREEKSSPASPSAETGRVEDGHCIPGGRSLMPAAGWRCPSTREPERERGVRGERESSPGWGTVSVALGVNAGQERGRRGDDWPRRPASPGHSDPERYERLSLRWNSCPW